MLLVLHPKNPLPRSMSRFFPMFSTKSLQFWGFTFKSLIHVIFCVWYKIRSNFILFMCISCFPTYDLQGYIKVNSVQFSSVPQSCLTLCDPMDCSTSGLPVYHQFLQLIQTYDHWVGDDIQPSHPLLSPSPPAFNLFQHKGLFQWVSSSHQVAKELEFQLQYQSFQWTPRTDLL